MRVLIAEDEPKVREFLQLHFQMAGHQVDGTPSAQGIREHLSRQAPDVLLLDMWLQDSKDGFAVLEEARRLAPRTAIIVITGIEEDTTRERALKLGALALLNKPIRLEELDSLVAGLSSSSPAV